MGKINLGRVIVGGIIAGAIVDVVEYFLNNVLLADQWRALVAAGKWPTIGMNQAIALFTVGLAFGLVAVWTYAAIRPRFGAGPKTAVSAGLLTWVTLYLLSDLTPLIFGTWPLTLFLILIGVGLVEIVVASAVGAWVYKEAETSA